MDGFGIFNKNYKDIDENNDNDNMTDNDNINDNDDMTITDNDENNDNDNINENKEEELNCSAMVSIRNYQSKAPTGAVDSVSIREGIFPTQLRYPKLDVMAQNLEDRPLELHKFAKDFFQGISKHKAKEYRNIGTLTKYFSKVLKLQIFVFL